MHQVKSLLVAVASSLLGLATAVAQPVPGLGAAGPADAAPKSPPAPLSARLGVVLPANVARVDLPGINLEEVLTQDAAPNQLRVRTGVSVPLDGFDPGMGQYLDVPGGGWLWVLDVRAPGARGVRVHFTDFNLPEGAQAIVYDPNAPASAPSPYTGRGPVDSGEFWAWTCFGERARVEVFLPADLGQARFNRYFKIDQALHIYRDPATGQATPYGARELSCHNDLQCYPEWTPIGQGVGCMSFVVNGEGFTCSGSMLSTGAGDLTPYFATARHCMEDNTGALQSLEVYWFFERTGCNGAWPELANCPHSAVASYVLTTPLSDTSLVMIEGRIPRNLYWLAQDPSPVPDGTEIRGIHHPRGTRKRISFGATLTGAICDDSGLWNGISIDWNNGVTEPGSSGSPLLRADGRFIGVCSCGIDPPRCPASGYEAKYGSWASHSGTYAGYMSAGADDSYENNDSCGSAYNLNSLYNGTLYGLVVKIYDDDWYRLTVPAFGNVSFRTVFTHDRGDIDMQLHDGCGGVLASSTSETNAEQVTWTNPSGLNRDVYLHVYLYDDTRNNYYLEFSRSNGPNPPPNDVCSTAPVMSLEGGNFVQGDTGGAGNDGSTNCVTSGADVWFRFSTPCTRQVLLTTYLSNFDTVLSVHTGCPGIPSNQVVCSDDAGPGALWSEVSFTATGGQTYYARIAGYQGAFGHFYLTPSLGYASDDSCTNALTVGPGSYPFNNCPCTTDGPPDDVCNAFGSNQIYRDFWLSYTPACDGTLELNTVGSNFDTKVAIYAPPGNASCPPGPNSAIACNDDISGADLQSRTTTAAFGGQRYILRIGSYDPDVGHSGVVNVLFTARPRNDSCANAVAIGDGSIPVCTDGATMDGPNEPGVCNSANFSQVGADIWYRYTSSCRGTVSLDLCSANYDSKVAVYGTPACPTQPGTALACNDDACGSSGLQTRLTFYSATAGQQFLIRVGGYQSAIGQGTLTLACTAQPCGSADFNGDGDIGTDADIEAFFACLGGNCCATCGIADFNGDGDVGTDQDIEAFFRVLSGGVC